MSEGRFRPGRLVVVLGTGTGVGKTWVTAAAVRDLRARGVAAVARKPVQSFDPHEAGATDAHVLGEASGSSPEEVCPPHRWYERAMAPPIAADALGRRPFDVTDLVSETSWPPGTLVGLAETAGGPRSPIAADGDSLALAIDIDPDLAVLVADPGLGAINAVRLSMAALAPLPCSIVVFLNRFDLTDPIHRSNRAYLESDAYDIETAAVALARRF